MSEDNKVEPIQWITMVNLVFVFKIKTKIKI